MDLREASAMTEESGLSDDAAAESLSPGIAGRRKDLSAKAAPARLAEQLRQTAISAPLRSLAAAFIVGVLVARRR